MKGKNKKQSALPTSVVIPTKEESVQEQVTINGLSIPTISGLLRRNDNSIGKVSALLGKYGSTSLIATSADFAMFHVGLAYLGATPVVATIFGRSVGSLVAFLLHRSWVFKNAKNRDGNVLRVKYVLGILIGMGLNAAGVWFLNGIVGMEPWPARIVTATTVWFFGFLFNKKIVFG